nr:ASPIC/UnbV domain-containing protein [Euryarchaeota archaeon]
HVYAGSGFLGSNEPTVHFGLGADDSVKSVEVVWSTGITQIERNVEADQTLVMEEPTSLFFMLFGIGLHQNINSTLYLLFTIILIGGVFKIYNNKNDSTTEDENAEEE